MIKKIFFFASPGESMVNKKAFTLLLSLLTWCVTAGQQCEKSHKGYLEGHAYNSASAQDYPTCIRRCLVDSRCKSVSYHLVSQVCDLSQETRKTKPNDYKAKEYRIYQELVGCLYDEISRTTPPAQEPPPPKVEQLPIF